MEGPCCRISIAYLRDIFLGGLQLFCIGILGQYISKTYLEVKSRPKYVIKETEEIYKNR